MDTLQTITRWYSYLTEASKRMKELGKMAPDEFEHYLSKTDMPSERKEFLMKKHTNYRQGRMFRMHNAGRNDTLKSYLDRDNRERNGRKNPKNPGGKKLIGREVPIDKVINDRDPKRKHYDPKFDTMKGRFERHKKYGGQFDY